MTITPPAPHYPTLTPVSIADLDTVLGALEVPDDLTADEAAAAARLRTTLTAALTAQAAARHTHPALDLDEPAVNAANLSALPVAMHAGGRTTEAHAARAMTLTAGTRRVEVLAELARHPDGLTDPEVETRLGWAPLDGARRRTELVKLGVVEAAADDAGATVTRPSPRGNPATVWKVTDDGLDALRSLGYTIVDRPVGDNARRLVARRTP